jgi:hypothetical protein
MANSIALANKFLPLLDEIYKVESKSAVLDSATRELNFLGANEVKIFKLSMEGLGNYVRNTGFATGSVTGTWETWTLAQDRGRSFEVDAMDQEETLELSFGKLAGEFLRTKVVPEVDAYRFAKYASTSGVSSANATLSKDTIVAAIDAAIAQMGEDEVPAEVNYLFITPTNYTLLKQSGAATRFATMTDNVLNRNFEVFDTLPVIQVPQTRFYSAIDLLTGVDADVAGGYAKDAAASDINFMIINKGAVEQVAKHAKPRIFMADINQDMDAHKFQYRIYHDCFVYENKVDGIYVHTKEALSI